jgi:hypothetical protein
MSPTLALSLGFAPVLLGAAVLLAWAWAWSGR